MRRDSPISKASLAGTARIPGNGSLGHCHLGCHQDTISLTPAGPPNDNFKLKAPTDATRQRLMSGTVAHNRPYGTSNPPGCILSRLVATIPVDFFRRATQQSQRIRSTHAGSLARRAKHQTGRPTRAGPRTPPNVPRTSPGALPHGGPAEGRGLPQARVNHASVAVRQRDADGRPNAGKEAQVVSKALSPGSPATVRGARQSCPDAYACNTTK